MSLFYSSWLFKLPMLRNYDAICIGRNIFFKNPESQVPARIHNHEMVHQKQMDKYTVVGFYFLYLWYYFSGLVYYQSHSKAYFLNPLESEAYNSGV